MKSGTSFFLSKCWHGKVLRTGHVQMCVVLSYRFLKEECLLGAPPPDVNGMALDEHVRTRDVVRDFCLKAEAKIWP